MVNFQVAIDGPAGSGKSSISGKVAKRLGFIHIDTGAMYRAVTLEALRKKVNLNNEEEFSFVNDITVVYINDKILLNGHDVGMEIRSDIVTKNVSLVSTHRIVRETMVKFQRTSAMQGKVLMDGRDIGSVVLPNADVKIFLTATAEIRAKRRLLELKPKHPNIKYEDVYNDLLMRDYNDSNREISPLMKAEDAILLDTTNLSIDEVCNKIIEIVNERLEG